MIYLANYYASLGDFQAGIYWCFEANWLRTKREESHLMSSEMRRLMKDINLPHFRDCLVELEPLSNSAYESFYNTTKQLWLTIPNFFGSPLWPSVVSTQAVQCYLNRTFPLEESYDNLRLHTLKYSYIGRYDLVKRAIEYTKEFHRSQNVELIDTLEMKYLEHYLTSQDLHEQSLEYLNHVTERTHNYYYTHKFSLFLLFHLGNITQFEHSQRFVFENYFKDWLQSPPQLPSSNCTQRKVVVNWYEDDQVSQIARVLPPSAQETFSIAKLNYLDDLEWSIHKRGYTFVEKPMFLLTMFNVTILPEFQLKTDCSHYPGYILGDLSPRDEFDEIVEVGRLAITSPIENNYFHRIIECASRLMLLVDQGLFDKPEYGDVKLLISNNRMNRFVIESFNISNDRILFLPQNVSFHTTQLFIPDWKRNFDPNANERAIQVFSPPQWSYRKLRDHYTNYINSLSIENPFDFDPNRKLIVYCHRNFTFARGIFDENHLIANLRQMALNNGHQFIVNHSKREIIQQAKIFQRADVVVGLHGACMSNLIFSKPNTTLVEFPVRSKYWDVFGYMSAALDLDYWIVPDVSSNFLGPLTLNRSKIDSIIRTTLEALKQKQ